jgi:fermentation-respiration switch protein FrsA (DUF1100 family)
MFMKHSRFSLSKGCHHTNNAASLLGIKQMITWFLAWFNPRRRRLLALAIIIATFPAGGLALLAHKERDLIFRIEPGIAGWYNGLPAGVQELDLPVSSALGSASLHAWWWPAASRAAPAILYLHGSRWNLTGQLYRIQQLRDFGFSVLAIDYRGFGKSKGETPSETTVYEDARVAWERLTALQPNPAKRFIYGHSLGGAVAVELAKTLGEQFAHANRRAAAGLIVESSFTSLADVAAAMTNMPIQWLLSQKFDSIDKISGVRMPVLLVHGTGDHYIPPRFSEELYAEALEPKKLLLIEGGSHNNSMRVGSAEYRKALQEFFGLFVPTRHASLR